jgi:hypothetical protein
MEPALKTSRNKTKHLAKNNKKLYVLKITNVNRINPYLKNPLMNSHNICTDAIHNNKDKPLINAVT